MVVGLGLMAFAVGRWSLLTFTVLALLFIGFMDLWENTMDTVALMAVSVAVSVSIGLPIGVIGARKQHCGWHHETDIGWYADDAELCLSAAGASCSLDSANRPASSQPSCTPRRLSSD